MRLEKEVVNILNFYLIKNQNLYANEIRMGNGIPDIMVGLSINHKIPYLDDYYFLKIYIQILQNRIDNLSVLINSFNIPKKKTYKILDELIFRELISVENDTIEVLNFVDFENQGLNISIEAKIRDWKKGLLQAQRYLSFSDYSYLAVKSDYLKNIDFKQANDLGVGIISVNEDEISEKLKPKKSKKCNTLFKHISLSHLVNKANLEKLYNSTFFNLCLDCV